MTTTSKHTFLKEIEAVPQHMAAEVAKLLPKATLESYIDFLDMMYHYTLGSEGRLLHAMKLTSNEELKELYHHLSEEEVDHYELALADLKSFGKEPEKETPGVVEDFQKYWESISAENSYEYLGAVYALESVADHIAGKAKQELARLGLNNTNATFVLVHLEADEEHGGLCHKLCADQGAEQSEATLRGAQEAAKFWIALHQCLVPTK